MTIATQRETRIAELRSFLRLLRDQQVIVKYEVTKNKSKSSVFGSKYKVKVIRNNSSDAIVGLLSLCTIIEAYIPSWAESDSTYSTCKFDELLAGWNMRSSDMKTLHAHSSLALLVKMARLEKFWNSQNLSTATQLNELRRMTESYL